jgi:sulfate adenylyltransferase subunit 1
MSHQSELISQDILGYLKQHENKDLLRFLTCGNVDDGKSTSNWSFTLRFKIDL